MRMLFLGLVILVLVSSASFADPSKPPKPPTPPPPPPAVTYNFYSLMDEFRGCGVENTNIANYCDKYYTNQFTTYQSGRVINSGKYYVCGKPPSCSADTLCTTSVGENTSWSTVTLEQQWICPNGYGLAKQHSRGNLDSGFTTISYNSQNSEVRSNSSINLNFNAFIPACVNRIPMMKLKVDLKTGNTSVFSKVGLYAKHETLSYLADSTGGRLDNFKIPQQSEFIKTYTLNAKLDSYRMWSFRQRFVEALNRIVASKNLKIPGNINVDSLSSTRAQDFENIYFSQDFMLGGFKVNNVNNKPSGTTITSIFTAKCNLDINLLNINSIRTSQDLITAVGNPNLKSNILSSLNANPSICGNIDKITNLKYINSLPTNGVREINKTISNQNIKLYGYSNFNSFRTAITNTPSLLNTTLISNKVITSKDWINKVKINPTIIVDANKNLLSTNFGFVNSSDFKNHINSVPLNVFETELKNNFVLSSSFYLKSINSITNIDNLTLRITFNYYTDVVSLDLNLWESYVSNSWALINIEMSRAISTSGSWNWRSLENLTLTGLSKCLYNWDLCFSNKRTQTGVVHNMQEISDLGFGPSLNSVAWKWSSQNLLANEGLVFTNQFDGAIGSKTIKIQIPVYKECRTNDIWISSEKYYSCFNGTIYKCGIGISNTENNLFLRIVSANYGDTIKTSGVGQGMVCINSKTQGPMWKNIGCFG